MCSVHIYVFSGIQSYVNYTASCHVIATGKAFLLIKCYYR